MPFEQLPDNKGMIYTPERRSDEQKHPCRDCYSCQWCSDDRCVICKGAYYCPKKKKPSSGDE